jgi:hypothetical protein
MLDISASGRQVAGVVSQSARLTLAIERK